METIKSFFFKPSLQEQNRKWQSTLRKEQRALDRQNYALKTSKDKAERQIKLLARKNDVHNVRVLAKEVVRLKRHQRRLAESKALLNSLGLQLNEQMANIKIQGAMQSSSKIMHSVSSLSRLPQLSSLMQSLSMEMTKAGVLEEMVDDVLSPAADEEDLLDEIDEEDEEVRQIIAQYMPEAVKSATPSVSVTPQQVSAPEPILDLPSIPKPVEEPVAKDELQESDILDIRGRLDALKS
ncbi:vacuolar sorting protein Vps24 [Schizosaccharomyces japonicus yFS275]|uniref:Vacuolar sorting protein Vps24 n=1 Tax=Schizosaccharomyces japonicus (strain yFS275 / FY16936) TaxID=402676 RepID=B6K517_SCHJY|nr:vacuolar sorting protein Vps24 [Schizosaccharomyces japonicus yFS275]EEB08621.1 vacuolar sorting protein Vps24 [Schizosaccharomyces japonicus yFS275]